MFIVEVIPIKKGMGKESLSYFSGTAIEEGSLIKIPLKRGEASAIVVKNREVKTEKSEIRKSDFALKKINRQKGFKIVSKAFVEASSETASFFIGAPGAVLDLLVPKVVLENAVKIKDRKIHRINTRPTGLIAEHLIIQDEEEERFVAYKSLIREEFAKNNSVLFCLPSIMEAKKAHLKLLKGIGQFAFILHSGLSKKEIINTWNKALLEEHPIVLVATQGFLSLPRDDFGLFIVDKEGTRYYKSITRPYIDIRHFVEVLAGKMNARVVFGDIALRSETIWRYRRAELSGIFPPKFKYLSSGKDIFVDMRKKGDDEEKKKFEVLSGDLKELLLENRDASDLLFIFAARRGLSPITACFDCGNIVKCTNCETPMVLHRASSRNIYSCHRCNNTETSERRCVVCKSWKLVPLGIGIELVEEEIKKFLPNPKVFRIDSDKTKTESRVLEVIEKWQNAPGSVLLGTEMALSYLPKLENVAVASIDSLFSVPDFRINEKIFATILSLRSLSGKNFLLQTRNPEQFALRFGITGNLLDFYKEEITEREAFGFPPFNLFIKISLSGEKERIVKEMEAVKVMLAGYDFEIFPAFKISGDKKYSVNAILRIKKNDYLSDEMLHEKLMALPPKFIIKVDPEGLL